MKNNKLLVSIVLLFCFAAASFAQQVKTDYDRSVNFNQYKTYTWEKVQTRDPLGGARIKNAANAALAAKGWTEVPSGGNISLIAIGVTQDQQSVNTLYNGFGGGWRWGGFGDSTTTVENYTVGTLVVYMFDTQTKQLVWRGSASDTLSDDSDRNIKHFDKGVQKMFKNFPPGAPKK
ncbi:MAG TPA: DUF4136 domain-containing protein [Terriglobales bacterium]|nr:DUF4136 domain-containing protein [Terriglobales bacterium]